MLAMCPGDTGQKRVNARPIDPLPGPRVSRECLNSGLFTGDRCMTTDTDRGCRKRHLFAGIGICMADPAIQMQLADVLLVTKRQRL